MNLKQNKTFKEKFDNGLSYKFDSNTPKKTRKTLKQDNTHVINFIMSYKNRSSLIFKVLGVVVYWFLRKYVCADYLCLKRTKQISVTKILWTYLVWWDLRNRNSRDFVKHCVLLWFFKTSIKHYIWHAEVS